MRGVVFSAGINRIINGAKSKPLQYRIPRKRRLGTAAAIRPYGVCISAPPIPDLSDVPLRIPEIELAYHLKN